MSILSSRFSLAFNFAMEVHQQQYRKRSDIPYVSHLLAVTAIVLEQGGDEDLAIAALLHDSAEDQGGFKILEKINNLFGSRVAQIVEGCSDSFDIPKPPWKERKVRYISELEKSDPDIILISLADKLHNSQAICRDLRVYGENTWEKFNGGRDGTLWYYQELVRVYKFKNANHALLFELSRNFREMKNSNSSSLD